MPLPDVYSELYPNRFIKADMLRGKKVTVTIDTMNIEVLEGDKGKQQKVVATLAGGKKPFDLVVCKTNGFCMKKMFGNNPREWVGKRITIYPTTTKFGRETVDCIRVWGSPDIAAEMKFSIPMGRKKPQEAVMHMVRPGELGFKGVPNPVQQTAPQETTEPDEVEVPGEEVGEITYFEDGAFSDAD